MAAKNLRRVAFLICFITSFCFAIFSAPFSGTSPDYVAEIGDFKHFLPPRNCLKASSNPKPEPVPFLLTGSSRIRKSRQLLTFLGVEPKNLRFLLTALLMLGSLGKLDKMGVRGSILWSFFWPGGGMGILVKKEKKLPGMLCGSRRNLPHTEGDGVYKTGLPVLCLRVVKQKGTVFLRRRA